MIRRNIYGAQSGASGAAIVASSYPTVSPGVVNTTVETAIASFTVAPGTVVATDVLVFEAAWDGLNNSGSAVTYTYRFKVGATAYATGAFSLGASASRWGARGRFRIALPTLATPRASGELFGAFAGSGFAGINTSHSGVLQPQSPTADFAGSIVVELTCQMGTANALADFRPSFATLTRSRVAA